MSRPLAFCGLGIMGLPMAGHLLAAGHRLTVYNRTAAKAKPLADAGAAVAATPADAARDARVVFLCLTDTPDVGAVLFGPDGVAETARPGTVVVDHSTISPTATEDFAVRLAERGVLLLDAPVSGGDAGAKAATLSIMAGGDPAAFAAVRPLLEILGKTITHCGPAGRGQATKLVNQVLVLGTLAAVCEAIALTEAGGLDPATTLAAVGGGAAKSWQLDNLWPKIAAGDFSPGFRADLALKDLRLVEAYAGASGVRLPGIARVAGLYARLIQQGRGGEGTQTLVHAVRP